MGYSIAFIIGLLIGISVMAVFAASTLDNLERKNHRLSTALKTQQLQTD